MNPPSISTITRRDFLATTATTGLAACLPNRLPAADSKPFQPKYILGSCMYGYTALAEVVPEVRKIGATAIDIWPKVHGNQREQLDEMGVEKFTELLKEHNVSLGCITQYKLGPFGLQEEMHLAKSLGCKLIVTGDKGPKDLEGKELKQAIKTFIEQVKPHLEVAEETGVTIAIENHSGKMLATPDSVKWFGEMIPSKHLALALAPYHLPQDEELLAGLIRSLGGRLAMFYAWQHGMGCMTKLPKEQELLQLPGRGNLNFMPLLSALADIHYDGWFEIFMHPVPRGIPILETTAEVSAEINKSRDYVASCLKKI